MRKISPPLIAHAVEDDQIIEMSVRQAMAHFSLRADEVREAREIAQATWPRKRLARVNARVAATRIRRRVLSHAVAHPGVHRRLMSEGWTCRHVADQYQINHAMAHIIRTSIKELCKRLREPMAVVIKSIEKEARRPDAVDRVNKPRGSYVRSAQRRRARRAAAVAVATRFAKT